MRPLIAGNWKMNGGMDWAGRPADFNALLPKAQREAIDVLICPPMPFLAPMAKSCQEAGVLLGAQNCHSESSGAHTGEVSAPMLNSVGAQYVLSLIHI